MRESIGDIPDTRNALLDYGLDGMPNTGDIGENNGILDDGERLDQKKLIILIKIKLVYIFQNHLPM